MTIDDLDEKPQKISRNIKNLYLDPNNYRFIDHDKHELVEEYNVLDARVQKTATLFIEGKNQENIKDLLISFKTNGFMDVDVIQVQDLGENKFKILEGNRRIAALKSLQEDFENGISIGDLDPSIFRSVPFTIHENKDSEKHLILMGLKHISGNKKWSTYNQATLIYDYLKPYKDKDRDIYSKKENQLCNSLGITKHKLRSMLRVTHLILEYKRSDFSDQFESRKYGLFEEIIKKPSIKDWLEWDDDLYYPNNRKNLARIFSWLSRTEERIDESIELGDFDEPYEELEPIISKSLEIRDLSLFIDNEQALSIMESERSLAQGLMSSGTVDKQNYSKALAKLKDTVTSLGSFQSLISATDVETIISSKEKLLSFLPKSHSLNIEEGNHSYTFEVGVKSHFTKINIESYKGIDNLNLRNLNKINIFAGLNNSGKTSLLEAVYLLSLQNDIGAYFKKIRLKNKLQKLSPVWLNQMMSSDISISGVFNDCETSVKFKKFEATKIDKKDDYIASYLIESCVDKRDLDNTVHTFAHQALVRENEKVERLCNSSFKSPYFYDFDEVLKEHTKSVEIKHNGKTLLNIVVEFLKEIDTTIKDVRLVDSDDIKRFIIESSKFNDRDLDITNYGEGLQRVFQIALSFASCRNGIICIDEFETAIHYSLLVRFTKFIQELAETFNVQVFLTSHSKECIDAFLKNDYSNDSITGILMENTEEGIEVKQVLGDRFKYLIDNINLDIRGNINGKN